MVEWASLKSALKASTDDRFSCVACLNQYTGREDYEAQTERLRKSKGCWGSKNTLHTIPEANGRVLRYSTCIGNWADPTWSHWFELHGAYAKGFLPFPGTYSDQPSKVMEVFKVIDQHVAEVVAEKERDMKRKAKAARKG